MPGKQLLTSGRGAGPAPSAQTEKRVTIACHHNSLATKRPDIAVELIGRNQHTAHDYTAGSGEKVFWRCKHGHEYVASIDSRTTKTEAALNAL